MTNPIPPIVLRDKGVRKNSVTPPLISTAEGRRDGSRGGGSTEPQGIIFQEDFSQQPDFTSGMHSTDREQFADTHTIPEGWYAVRQDPNWAPSVGYPDGHESIEILSDNSDKARSGGKSYVSWRDSSPEPEWRWNSESILSKYFPDGYDQLYVEFWITFSNDWTWEGSQTSKIFRIFSWDESSPPSIFNAFGGGNIGPLIILNAQQSFYGVRNYLSFRGGPWGDNYLMTSRLTNTRRTPGSSGSLNMNFTGDTQGYGLTTSNEVPQIVDRVNGGYISDDLNQTVTPQQIYGDENHWTKYAFFVKMNSAPEVADGEFWQWLDDELIFRHTELSYVDGSEQLGDPVTMPKWNVVEFGGNDYFKVYPDEDKRQEWYAIDDIVVRNNIPEELNV